MKLSTILPVLLLANWLFVYQVCECDMNMPNLFGISQSSSEEETADARASAGALDNLYATLNSFSSDPAMKETICGTCSKALTSLKFLIGIGLPKDMIANSLSSLCTLLNLYDSPSCEGTVNVFKDSVFYVMQRTNLTVEEICGVLLGATCKKLDSSFFSWTIPLPPKSPINPVANYQYKKRVYRILHLTDIHYDPMYTEGSSWKCKRPLCCQPYDFPVADNSSKAGKWGSYQNCDIPLITIESMLNHIRNNHTIDMVYWTGDIIAHDLQIADKKENIETIRFVGSLLKRKFGKIPVYAAVGNHEALPIYSFPPPDVNEQFSISWLYDTLSEVYGNWLPKYTIPTIRKRAYYSVRLKNNLKIISLNSNYCGHLNFWLLLNSTDPADQLSWLVDELHESELIGEKIHIVSHFPPGKFDCLKVWSDNYYRIINRFESTVMGQFFGHTHVDEFELFYNDNLTRPSNVAYVGPSVTPHVNVNPSYRIYKVDGSSWALLDHETYFMNLSEANDNPNKEPVWSLSYSAKAYYGLNNLHPEEWNRLVNTFQYDDEMFQKFYRVYKTRSDSNFKVCQGQCKDNMICGLKTGRSNDPTLCKSLKGI